MFYDISIVIYEMGFLIVLIPYFSHEINTIQSTVAVTQIVRDFFHVMIFCYSHVLSQRFSPDFRVDHLIFSNVPSDVEQDVQMTNERSIVSPYANPNSAGKAVDPGMLFMFLITFITT